MPGDKSLTQRSLILASLANGRSRLSGLLYGGDSASTAGALRALGAKIGKLPADGSELLIDGVGLEGLQDPTLDLDLGNSGTGSRLLLGVLAGSEVVARITGDTSLRSRPMARVTEPLVHMGANFDWSNETDRLPVTVRGTRPLADLAWTNLVASAQVKSAILLAGLTGGASVTVTEPRQSRDHTERMLNGLGVLVEQHEVSEGWRVAMIDPPDRIEPVDFIVPGDISSAAFLLTFAALGGTPEPVTVESVGLNPTRSAFLDVLNRMGAEVSVEIESSLSSEPVGSITVGPTELQGVEVGSLEVPRLIDELPLVAALGARAHGVTVITGAEELRSKESDRISAMVDNLRAVGVRVEEYQDGLAIEGTKEPLIGAVESREDHRITMAFGVLGAVNPNNIRIDDQRTVDVSFPGFWSVIDKLAGGIGRA